MTRGIKHDVDRMINELQGKYLPFKAWKDKKLQDFNLQLSIRPIQLFEIVYPEAYNDSVLNSILKGQTGETQHKKHKKYIWALRKMLDIQPIPQYKKDSIMPFYNNNIELIGIGVKKDYWINKKGEHIKNPTDEEKKNMQEGI